MDVGRLVGPQGDLFIINSLNLSHATKLSLFVRGKVQSGTLLNILRLLKKKNR